MPSRVIRLSVAALPDAADTKSPPVMPVGFSIFVQVHCGA